MYRHTKVITFTEIYVVQKCWSVILHVQIILLEDSYIFQDKHKKDLVLLRLWIFSEDFLLKMLKYSSSSGVWHRQPVIHTGEWNLK